MFHRIAMVYYITNLLIYCYQIIFTYKLFLNLYWLEIKTECTIMNIGKKNLPYFFQYKLSNRNETGANHYGLLSISIYSLNFFLRVHLHGGSQPNFSFFNVNPQIFQRNRKVHLTNCLETNFQNISNISLRVIRRRNYN